MTTLYTVRPGPVLHVWQNGREIARFEMTQLQVLDLIAKLAQETKT